MLGAAQLEWLLGRIKMSTAETLLLVSSNTFTFSNGNSLSRRDSWTGCKRERDHILQALAACDGLSVLVNRRPPQRRRPTDQPKGLLSYLSALGATRGFAI